MSSTETVRDRQSGKRRRLRSTSATTGETSRKKHKSSEPPQNQNDPANEDIATAQSSKPAQSGHYKFMGGTSKPSFRKSAIGDAKASIKPDPQPIRSDITGLNGNVSGSNKRKKKIPILDLTGDSSDEPTQACESADTLQKQVTELTSERNDYRRSLHDANKKIHELNEEKLFRKVRPPDQTGSDKRETSVAAAERESQTAKAKKDVEEQLTVSRAEAVRLQQRLDQQIAECNKISSEKKDQETKELRLQEAFDKQLKESEWHKGIKESLSTRYGKKEKELDQTRKRLSETTDMCKRLLKDKSSLRKQLKSEQAQTTTLQQELAQQKQTYDAEVLRFEASEKQYEKRMEVEMAKARALAKSDLEKQAEEHESTITRQQMEMEKMKHDIEEQKEAADWYKAKFLKFKGWFYTLEKESQEKDAAMRRVLTKALAAVGVDFDHLTQ
ncbi:hypothetical protein N0V93_008361 [Gnomoniopsis smithogilvyi]|uniref:Uncharacterized protein n=1 Tax=Gnomoniopsis smithogilvyi TaxID=1191159 RepID=A0A9W8YPW9_9PEZI|nr:hypothetical protein N0V93_008361 [Gnomoniopsis smithogilvyi]